MLYFFAGKAVVVVSHGLTKSRLARLTRRCGASSWLKPILRSSRLDRSRAMARKPFHSKAAKFLYNRYIAGDPKREKGYEEEVINAEIARKIYRLRTQAGLTQ